LLKIEYRIPRCDRTPVHKLRKYNTEHKIIHNLVIFILSQRQKVLIIDVGYPTPTSDIAK